MAIHLIRSATLLVLLTVAACSSDRDYSSPSASGTEAEQTEALSDAGEAESGSGFVSDITDEAALAPGFEVDNAESSASAYGDEYAYGADVSEHGRATALNSLPSSCYGTSALRICTDASGNTYTTQRIGDLSYTDGHNAQTGSSWNQSTQRIGDMSFTTGTDADGDSWNSTTQRIGDTTFQYGTNSEGESFSSSCNEHGCY
jgi:hypothetical protein